ncbi:MAG: signal peptidase [Legionellales bacterium RIFCSPHIGHO2_12_FULL_37_14]|nr:MAG: signal peptidase [Legionellales bacterium RIFCSPHIGHO2_12_FULL_37_14]
MRFWKNIIFMLFLGFTMVVYAAEAPVAMLNQVASEMVTILKKHQGSLQSNPKIVHTAVEKYLLPHVDLAGMARSVLGKEAWMHASEKERAAFTHEFKELVIRTYGSSLAKYQGETIKFHPVRGGVQGRFVRVESEIERVSGPPIALNYSLVSKNGQWKVYDLTVEGVSLLQSYHSQFAEALRHQTLPELIEQIKRRAA